MTTQSEFEIDEEVPGTAWNRCKSFLTIKRRIVVSVTICLIAIILFSVFVSLIIKSRYHEKDLDTPKTLEDSSKGIYGKLLYKDVEFILSSQV